MSEILYCTKCGWQGNEIGGHQYSDGSVDQWCPKCEKSDDFINEYTDSEVISAAKDAGWRWNGNAYIFGDRVCRRWQDLPIEEFYPAINNPHP